MSMPNKYSRMFRAEQVLSKVKENLEMLTRRLAFDGLSDQAGLVHDAIAMLDKAHSDLRDMRADYRNARIIKQGVSKYLP